MANSPALPLQEVPADFEKSVEELESIVQKMEDGRLTLEESLVAYQRGTELVKLCESRLRDAQARIAVLEGDTLKDLKVEDA